VFFRKQNWHKNVSLNYNKKELGGFAKSFTKTLKSFGGFKKVITFAAP